MPLIRGNKKRQKLPPNEPLHSFGALKSVVRPSWTTLNFSIHGLKGSKIVKGLYYLLLF